MQLSADEPAPAAAPATTAAPSPRCRMAGTLSGALEQPVLWEAPLCSTAQARTDPAALDLQWAQPKVLLFQVTLPNPAVTLGATTLPATVLVRQHGGQEWRTLPGACTVEIARFGLARQTALGDLYDLRGVGHCASPAVADSAAPLTIGDFAFSTAPLL